MFNTQLRDQLNNMLQKKSVKVRFPKGYNHWRKRFHSALREAKGDVLKALDIIHGKSSKRN